jgi:hypothetical protein
MPRDSRYDLLFEPVQIGPVTAKIRFYQVVGPEYSCCLGKVVMMESLDGWELDYMVASRTDLLVSGKSAGRIL